MSKRFIGEVNSNRASAERENIGAVSKYRNVDETSNRAQHPAYQICKGALCKNVDTTCVLMMFGIFMGDK